MNLQEICNIDLVENIFIKRTEVLLNNDLIEQQRNKKLVYIVSNKKCGTKKTETLSAESNIILIVNKTFRKALSMWRY